MIKKEKVEEEYQMEKEEEKLDYEYQIHVEDRVKNATCYNSAIYELSRAVAYNNTSFAVVGRAKPSNILQ